MRSKDQISPGDQVAVYNHEDVVDGAQGTVLGINPSGWLAVRLSQSGAHLILSASKIRRVDEATRQNGVGPR
jgi:hypothetical protein